MATRLEMLQALSDRLEAEQLQAVELLASAGGALADVSETKLRRLADLHTVLCAVRDEISRHAPRMGYGSDSLST
jgi:hypothetical protein